MFTDRIKVLLVDDHPVVAEGTVSVLSTNPSFIVLETAHNGSECLQIVSSQKPDVILLDIKLPDVCGINLIDKLLKIHPGIKIIMFTGYNPEEYVASSLLKGAHGFLLKDCSKREMIQAVLSVFEGVVYFPDGMGALLRTIILKKEHQSVVAPLDKQCHCLTPREIDIIVLVSKGMQNKEIANILEIKTRTVEFHVSSILSKLGVHSRLEAVLVWLKSYGGANVDKELGCL